MGIGNVVDQVLETALAFGRVVRATARRFVIETEDDLEAPEADAWGHAAILVRPAAPNSDGAFEVVSYARGDELIPLASRDVRWVVELDEGEVVLRAFGQNAARVRLKADGKIILEGTSIEALGTRPVAYGDDIKFIFDAFANASPVVNDGGAAIQQAFKVAMQGKQIKSSKVKVG